MELVLQRSMKMEGDKERKLALKCIVFSMGFHFSNGSPSPNIWRAQVESNYYVLSVVGEES